MRTLITILTLLTIADGGQDQKTLHGIVTDGYRNSLAAITVVTKGTAVSATTDACGRFSLPLDKGEFTLVFHGMSYDDLRTYEIRLKSSELTSDTTVFQLGHLNVENPGCNKVDEKSRVS